MHVNFPTKLATFIFFPSAEMEKGIMAYREVLRLVRRLPANARPYYAKFARENFVNYRKLDDPHSLPDLLLRTYNHSLWVLNKYSVDMAVTDRLKKVCSC